MSRSRVGRPTVPFLVVYCQTCGILYTGKSWKTIHVCKGCHNCRSCGCVCFECRACGRTHGGQKVCWCCQQCETVCSCRKRPGWYKGLDQIKTLAVRGVHRVVNTLQRPLSVEVELAEWKGVLGWGGGTYFHYMRVHDGSVVPSGQEMVSTPMTGDQVVYGLSELGGTLAQRGATINNTCGFHVHVDATEFSYQDILRLLWLYLQFEDDIYNYLVTPDRVATRYCKKLDALTHKLVGVGVKSPQNKQLVRDVLYEMCLGGRPTRLYPPGQQDPRSGFKTTIHTLRASKYGAGERQATDRRRVMRYAGFNIYSWFHRGSVEFRMKEGLLDPVDMIGWTLLCGWLVEAAYRLDDSIYQQKKLKLMDFLYRGYKDFKPPEFIHRWAVATMRKLED